MQIKEVRQCRYLFDKKSIYHNIPSLVQYLCLNYFWISEYFVYCSQSSDIKLNEEKNSAQIIKIDSSHTIYGNIDIDGTVADKYEWKFRVWGFDECCIGIDSSNKKYYDEDYTNPNINEHNFYAYYNWGNKLFLVVASVVNHMAINGIMTKKIL